MEPEFPQLQAEAIQEEVVAEVARPHHHDRQAEVSAIDQEEMGASEEALGCQADAHRDRSTLD